jgi:threonine/homoserine/homoserine lactone efflux protein
VFELIAFLALVGIISISGVMMPGPVFIAAVAKGAEHKHAGAWIALGHLIVEVPLILVLAAGFSFIFENIWAKMIIGLVGGGLLVYIGLKMMLIKDDPEVISRAFPMHPILAGIITTASNPYFILWWATIGVLLVFTALTFGWFGVLAFIIVHESCDLAWDWFVSYTVHESKKLWTENVYKYLIRGCGLVLIGFGIYFILVYWLA